MIKFEGLEDITERIDSITDTKRIERAMGTACAMVERSAKMKAPKGNGVLRNSITSDVKQENGDVIGVVYTPLEYAPYVEYGTGIFAEDGKGRQDVPWHYKDDKGEWHTTSGMTPSPYMRPALNENRENIKRKLKEALLDD